MKYDVIVCGGGIAGIASALSARRAGAEKVLLLEREYTLGGLATLGLVTIYLPLCDGRGTQVSFGIAEELLKLSASEGVEVPIPECWQTDGDKESRAGSRYLCRFNPWLFAMLSEKLLVGEGVTVLYGAQAVEPVREDGKLTAIVSANKEGLVRYEADAFVDATGDAVLFDKLGERTCLREEGNYLAGWYYTNGNGIPNLCILGSSESSADGKPAPAGVTSEEASDMMLRTHDVILEDFRSKGGKTPPTAIAYIPQIRMSRRIAGAAAMSYGDSFCYREDSVGLISDWRKSGPVFEMPFAALHGDTPNLFAAGRVVAAEGEMWDVTRVIPCCAVSGEAAGLAAVYKGNLARIQEALVCRGVPLHVGDVLKEDR